MTSNEPKPADLAFFSGAHAQMFQVILGYNVSQIVSVAAQYSWRTICPRGLRPRSKLPPVNRWTSGYFSFCARLRIGGPIDGRSRFKIRRDAITLGKNDTMSLRGSAMLMPAKGRWQPWGELAEAVRTGEPQAVAALGCTAWE